MKNRFVVVETILLLHPTEEPLESRCSLDLEKHDGAQTIVSGANHAFNEVLCLIRIPREPIQDDARNFTDLFETAIEKFDHLVIIVEHALLEHGKDSIPLFRTHPGEILPDLIGSRDDDVLTSSRKPSSQLSLAGSISTPNNRDIGVQTVLLLYIPTIGPQRMILIQQSKMVKGYFILPRSCLWKAIPYL